MEPERLLVQNLAPAHRQLRLAVVTETYPPEVNGVAMTTGRIVEGLLALGHAVQLIRPRQHAEERPVRGESFDELLSRGIPIPRYNHLKMGLPARHALVRAWTAQRPDLVQVVTEGPLGWSAISAARKLKLPVITEFHTNFHTYSRYYGMGWLKQPVAAYLRRFHNKGDLALVPTEALCRALLGDGYQQVEVVSRGVDTRLFSPLRRSESLRAQWGAGPATRVCAIVSRLAPEKNLELAVHAFDAFQQHCPDSRLVVVGDGPARAVLQARHPQHVFAGMRSGEDLAAHYASADCFLFPSLTETFGNVISEALASGLPVLCFDYAAGTELVRHGGNGLLAPYEDAASFIALAARLGREPALLAALGEAARPSVVGVDWQAVVTRLVAIQQSVIQRHAARLGKHGTLALQED